jgi:hypothetical protein
MTTRDLAKSSVRQGSLTRSAGFGIEQTYVMLTSSYVPYTSRSAWQISPTVA